MIRGREILASFHHLVASGVCKLACSWAPVMKTTRRVSLVFIVAPNHPTSAEAGFDDDCGLKVA
jgi:hypothetical protein